MGQINFEVPGPGTYSITADPTLPALSNPGASGDALSGKQFYTASNAPVTGTIPLNEPQNITIEGGGSYVIPQGYHYGTGVVTSEGTTLPTLPNPGTAADLLTGTQLIDQEGNVVQGSMPNNGAVAKSLGAGESYTIPLGYHNGQGTVTANSLANQTQGTATAEDIMQGETAWVNGQQVTGTATPGTDTSDATATADQILSPYTAYVASGKVTGTIPTNTDDDVTISGAQVSVGAGYYADAVSKAIQTVAQDAGYVAQGTESATQQLPTQGAQTITPTTTAQTIEANVYLTGAQTIQGDANLVSRNIKDGISIFGVTGSYGGDPSVIAVPLVVTVTTGAVVTAVNGDLTVTATSIDGTATLTLTQPGDWSVSATLNGETAGPEIVTVPSSYSIRLNFVPVRTQVLYLSIPRSSLASSQIGEYALFAGGHDPEYGGSTYDTVDAFNSALSLSQPYALSAERYALTGASNGTYAFFAGGYTSLTNAYLDTVDAYDPSLSRTTPTPLGTARAYLSSITIGQYILVAGGYLGSYPPSNYVDAYDITLTRTVPTALTTARYSFGSALAGQYALFGGGQVSRIGFTNAVEAYDETLTKTFPEVLSKNRGLLGTTSVGDYAIFAGGAITSGSTTDETTTVDYYDSTLTRGSASSLSSKRRNIASATLNGYALFGGGDQEYDVFPVVDTYSSSLTHSTTTAFSQSRTELAAVKLDNYVLFGGGCDDINNDTPYANVDIYE